MLLIAIASALLALSPSPATGYATPEAAALALADSVPHDVKAPEFAAAIWAGPAGLFYVSTAIAQGDDSFAARLLTPPSFHLVALFHTHPGRESQIAAMFSPEDVAVARKLGIASYIRFAASGSVRVYAPWSTRTALRDVNGWRVQISYGDAIG